MSIERPGAAQPRPVGPLALRPLLLLASCLWWARPALAQQLDVGTRDSLVVTSPVIGEVYTRSDTAAESADATKAPKATKEKWPSQFLIHWNEYNLGFSTFLWGAAVLTDYASFNQDSMSAAHFNAEPQGKIRDSRVMLFGRLRTERPVTWQTGLMYDWAAWKWKVRLSMISVAAPEISSQFQIGRLKEGLSLNRVISGYDGWTSERFTFSDAAIPLLADGIKWMGYVPDKHVLWNLGFFTNALSEGESFSYYEHQVLGRLAYLRMDSETAGTLWHVGAGIHIGKPEHDTLQLKSKPEVFASTPFIDTGKFPASRGTIGGLEVYYRDGSRLYGTEYYVEQAQSPQVGNPVFHGGDAFFSWIVTGETRPYTAPLGTFRAISPARPVFKGGPGAWEAVLRVSYIDLDTDSLSGGKLWRVTPMVNWHLNDQARLELTYGISGLDRFGGHSTTEFFQARLQLQFTKLSVATD
jgi:phosphate-selective porin OprO/OprP